MALGIPQYAMPVNEESQLRRTNHLMWIKEQERQESEDAERMLSLHQHIQEPGPLPAPIYNRMNDLSDLIHQTRGHYCVG